MSHQPPSAGTARAPTLREVAAAAGVSVSTAARVLRGDAYPVDPDLRQRVEATALTLRYVPNLAARNLRRGTPATVGLVVGNMLEPYYGEIAQAVTEHAEATGQALAIVCNMQRDPLLELKYCQQLWEHRVAGLILAGGLFDQETQAAALSQLVQHMVETGVVVASLSPRALGIPVFSADNRAVGEAMAGHLVERGHREIGILLGPARSEVAQQRLAGAADRLAAAKLRFHVLHLTDAGEAPTQAASRLAAEHRKATGFIVGSDSLAAAMLEALHRLGRPDPPAASIVGVGNTRSRGGPSAPLASVDVGLARCSRAALDYIAALVARRAAPAFTPPQPRVVLAAGLA